MLLTLLAAVLIYRLAFHLSWSATAAFLVVVVVGAALYWRLFRYKVPLTTSRRGRRLLRSGAVKVNVKCGSCGWRGDFLSLTSRAGEGGVEYFCPACGREVAHST